MLMCACVCLHVCVTLALTLRFLFQFSKIRFPFHAHSHSCIYDVYGVILVLSALPCYVISYHVIICFCLVFVCLQHVVSSIGRAVMHTAQSQKVNKCVNVGENALSNVSSLSFLSFLSTFPLLSIFLISSSVFCVT